MTWLMLLADSYCSNTSAASVEPLHLLLFVAAHTRACTEDGEVPESHVYFQIGFESKQLFGEGFLLGLCFCISPLTSVSTAEAQALGKSQCAQTQERLSKSILLNFHRNVCNCHRPLESSSTHAVGTAETLKVREFY